MIRVVLIYLLYWSPPPCHQAWRCWLAFNIPWLHAIHPNQSSISVRHKMAPWTAWTVNGNEISASQIFFLQDLKNINCRNGLRWPATKKKMIRAPWLQSKTLHDDDDMSLCLCARTFRWATTRRRLCEDNPDSAAAAYITGVCDVERDTLLPWQSVPVQNQHWQTSTESSTWGGAGRPTDQPNTDAS